MNKKSIIISIIVILILIIAGLFIYNLPKEEPIEPMPTVEPIKAEEETTVEIETTTEEVNTLMQETGIATFNAKQGTVEGYVATEETTTEEVINEGTEGDPTQQDIQIPESKPTPESITPQSEVEDMIAAYPDEITPELQAELDDIKDWYEQGLLPIEAYKEDTYNTLYGPSAEELDRQLQEIINDAVKDNYIPATDAAKALGTPDQGEVGPAWDPNHERNPALSGYHTY